jgi:hypothetical protein
MVAIRESSPIDPLRVPLDSVRVHFAGPWTRSERQLVDEAVAEVEHAGAACAMPVLGKPWVCTCHHGSRPIYLAHRAHWMTKVLVARSAEELAQRIQEYDGYKVRACAPSDVGDDGAEVQASSQV